MITARASRTARGLPGGAVFVLAVTDARELVLVEQYRVPVMIHSEITRLDALANGLLDLAARHANAAVAPPLRLARRPLDA